MPQIERGRCNTALWGFLRDEHEGRRWLAAWAGEEGVWHHRYELDLSLDVFV
jgi:hypothetical protein